MGTVFVYNFIRMLKVNISFCVPRIKCELYIIIFLLRIKSLLFRDILFIRV